MPRRDDDELDDDRPRRRPRDDDDDRPQRSRRSRDDDDDGAPPKKKSNLALILIIIFLVVFVLCGGAIVGGCYLVRQGVTKVQGAADRMNSSNNLKEIGIGVHSFADKNDDMPANTYSADDKPLLSWRVQLLPFIGEEGLYRQFKLDEPWDSPNNKRLLSQMPLAYATPAERMGRTPKGTTTYYRGFSNPGAVFSRRSLPRIDNGPNPGVQPPRNNRLRFVDFTDGTSNTLLVVEAGEPVEWTKPDDLDISAGKPFPQLGGVRPDEQFVLVLYADGSVRPVKKSSPETAWRGASTYAGNEMTALDPEP